MRLAEYVQSYSTDGLLLPIGFLLHIYQVRGCCPKWSVYSAAITAVTRSNPHPSESNIDDWNRGANALASLSQSATLSPLPLGNVIQGRKAARLSLGRRANGFLGVSLNDMTILFLVFLWDNIGQSQLDKTIFALGRSPSLSRSYVWRCRDQRWMEMASPPFHSLMNWPPLPLFGKFVFRSKKNHRLPLFLYCIMGTLRMLENSVKC